MTTDFHEHYNVYTNVEELGDLPDVPHRKFPKIPRLENMTYLITEKLDGTNGVIFKHTDENGKYFLKFGSRNKWLTKYEDNFGFFKFCTENLDLILELPDGTHYGEFIGKGIQRGYNLDYRRFYLFNTHEGWAHIDSLIRPVPLLGGGILSSLYKNSWYNSAVLKVPSWSMIDTGTPMEGIMIKISGQKESLIKVIINK